MSTNGDAAVEVVPVRHVGQWFAMGFVALLIAMFVHTLFSKIPSGARSCHLIDGRNQCHAILKWRFGWNLIFHYFTNGGILRGLVVTIELTALAMLVGIVLGVVVAIMPVSYTHLRAHETGRNL